MKFYNGTIDNPYHPFSNRTQALMWYGENCDRCSKAYHPGADWPKDETVKQYVRCGKYCKLQYWIDIGFIDGSIPYEIAEQIGISEMGLKNQCLSFSDNDDDSWRPPKRPKPDNTPDNQLVMPFLLEQINSVTLEKI